MKELAKLEEERGNPGYTPADRVVRSDSKERTAGYGRGSIADGLGGAGEKKGKREREPGRDYRAWDCGDVCEYSGGGGGVL